MTRSTLSLRFLAAVCAVALLLAGPAPAQNRQLPPASELLERYAATVAAKEDDGYLRVTLHHRMREMSMTSRVFQAPGGLRLMRTEMAGIGAMEVGHDAEGYWMRDPFGGARVLDAGEGAALIPNLTPPAPGLDDILSAETLSEERLGGQSCVTMRLVMASEGPAELDLCIDEESGLPVRSALRSPKLPGELVSHFEDYRTFGGAPRPFRIRTRLPDGSEAVVETLELNDEPFDHSVFQRPAELR